MDKVWDLGSRRERPHSTEPGSPPPLRSPTQTARWPSSLVLCLRKLGLGAKRHALRSEGLDNGRAIGTRTPELLNLLRRHLGCRDGEAAGARGSSGAEAPSRAELPGSAGSPAVPAHPFPERVAHLPGLPHTGTSARANRPSRPKTSTCWLASPRSTRFMLFLVTSSAAPSCQSAMTDLAGTQARGVRRRSGEQSFPEFWSRRWPLPRQGSPTPNGPRLSALRAAAHSAPSTLHVPGPCRRSCHAGLGPLPPPRTGESAAASCRRPRRPLWSHRAAQSGGARNRTLCPASPCCLGGGDGAGGSTAAAPGMPASGLPWFAATPLPAQAMPP